MKRGRWVNVGGLGRRAWMGLRFVEMEGGVGGQGLRWRSG